MRQRSRLAGVATIALAAAGCFWTSPGAGPSRTAHNVFEDKVTPETVADLGEVWTATIDTGAVGQPTTSNNAVHFIGGAGEDKHVYGVDAQTGTELWDRGIFTPFGGPASPPVFAHDVLWVGYGTPTGGGNYVTELLDPDTGTVTGTPPGVAGLVDGVRGSRYLIQRAEVIPSQLAGGFRVSVRDLEDPEAGWTAAIYGGDLGDLGDPGTLTLGYNSVYQAGTGFFVDETGNTTSGNGLRSYAIEGPGSCGDQSPCPPTWAVELDGSTATSPVVARRDDSLDDATVFTGTDAGTVYAVDAASGDVLWSTSVGSGVSAEPALTDDHLYVPTTDGELVVLDPGDGSPLWRAALGDAAQLQPAVAGGLVFVAAGDMLRAFHAEGCGQTTCDPLWSTSTGSGISGAPAVSNGQVFVGTQDGRLIAYGLPE